VDLNSVETSFQSTLHRRGKSSLEVLDVLRSHLLRFRVQVVPGDCARGIDIVWPAVQVFASNSARREPGRHSAGFSACVTQLDHHLLALTVGKLDDFLQVLDLAVLPKTHVFRSDTTLRRNGSRFDTGDTGTTLDDAAHVLVWLSAIRFPKITLVPTYRDVPHGVVPIISRVLAEWRERDAVVESQATELERFEEFRDALGLFSDESSARRRVLSGCEVWDARCGLVDVVRLFFDVRLNGVVGSHCD
jgi:hypothetical protein